MRFPRIVVLAAREVVVSYECPVPVLETSLEARCSRGHREADQCIENGLNHEYRRLFRSN